MRNSLCMVMLVCLALYMAGCSAGDASASEKTADVQEESGGLGLGIEEEKPAEEDGNMDRPYTVKTKISEVINDPVFGGKGRMLFPVDSGYYSGSTLGDLRLTWYSNMDADKTVEIANYMGGARKGRGCLFFRYLFR